MNVRLPALLIIPALLAGCGQAPGPTAPGFALGATGAAPRGLLAADAGEPWAWEPRADAPWSAFPRGDRPPNGPAWHLDFHAVTGGDVPEGRNKVYFTDGVAFTLRLVEGPDLAVVDADARDGEATVALPAGAHDGWLARLGKPGGTLAVTDATFFRRETLAMDGGPRDWVRLGARALPFPWAAERGPDGLRFEPAGLTGFSTRWFGAPAPDVPPLPPMIVDLAVPDELVAGETGPCTAVAEGPYGLPAGATFRWTTTDPDGAALPAVTTTTPTRPWLAPAAPGRYLMGVVVETPWFRASSPAAKPTRVRRELFLDSYGPRGIPRADDARAIVADTWPLKPGQAFTLAAEGTMNPWGVTGGYYCGAPEPLPMYPSPDRPVGIVALDAAYFFALPSATTCTFDVKATKLLGFSADGGVVYTAPLPLEGAYQPSHRYTFPAVVGKGQPLFVRCLDPRVWDNYGRFKITIRRPG